MTPSENIVPVSTAPMVVEKGHPRGLYVLFGTEMWERFGFYGMRALLGLYMMGALGFSQEQKSHWYGWYLALVYLTPIVGGRVADRYLGYRRTIILGAILLMCGYFLLMVPDFLPPEHRIAAFVCALGVLIVGNGFFKANISTVVGKLYKRGDPRRDAGFSIFYMGINVGATFSPLLCGHYGERYTEPGHHPVATAFKWGFLIAGIGMFIGLINFLIGRRRLSAVDLDTPEHVQHAQAVALPAAGPTSESERKLERGRIAALLIIIAFTIPFWMGFEQAGNTLTDWAKDNTLLNLTLPVIGAFELRASYFQAVNAAFIIILAPLFSILWLAMARRKVEPSTPLKMVFGLLFVGVGYVAMVTAALAAGSDAGRVSALWLVLVYLLHTIGELCLSPIGLSLVTKLAPARLGGTLMGVWFFATFCGIKLSGNIGGLWTKISHVQFFELLIVTSAVPALILLLLLPKLKKMIAGAA